MTIWVRWHHDANVECSITRAIAVPWSVMAEALVYSKSVCAYACVCVRARLQVYVIEHTRVIVSICQWHLPLEINHCIRIWMKQRQQYGLLKNPVAWRSVECLVSKRLLLSSSSFSSSLFYKINFLRLKSVCAVVFIIVVVVMIVNNVKFALHVISMNEHVASQNFV